MEEMKFVELPCYGVSGPFRRGGVNVERFELDQRFGVAEPNWLRGSRLFPNLGVNRCARCLAMWSDGQMEAMMCTMELSAGGRDRPIVTGWPIVSEHISSLPAPLQLKTVAKEGCAGNNRQKRGGNENTPGVRKNEACIIVQQRKTNNH